MVSALALTHAIHVPECFRGVCVHDKVLFKPAFTLGTCEASRFDSNFRFGIRFVVMIDSKFLNRPHRQSSFVKNDWRWLNLRLKSSLGVK